jgi:hypothetical protein
MAQTTVSDFVIWAKHIHGDPALNERVLSLGAGETVRLRVDGVSGAWRRMDDGRDGRPTRGIRPIGRTQAFWRELYARRRGEVVTVELIEEADRPGARGALPISPPFAASEAERQAAAAAFLALGGQGWRSAGPYGSRDEIYDR